MAADPGRPRRFPRPPPRRRPVRPRSDRQDDRGEARPLGPRDARRRHERPHARPLRARADGGRRGRTTRGLRASLFGGADEPILIRDITIEGPFVTYELKGIHDNLHKLLSNLGVDDEDEPEKEEKKDDKEEKAPGRKVVIEHFLFKDAKVRVAVAGGKGAVVPLPDIELKDIGRSSGGATVLDATGQILRQITVGTVVAVKDVLVDLGGAAVDAAVATGSAAVDAVSDAASAAADAVGDAASAVTGAIGSLFGGGDDGAKEDKASAE